MLDHFHKKAVLVYISLNRLEDIDWNIKEFLSLAFSARIQIIKTVMSYCKVISSRYFIGTGKLLELNDVLGKNSVSVVLFSCTLSPNQERNLIRYLKCEIIDRNRLILNIFAQRAKTYEGKLQVELARLRYLNSRLIHEWSHLERQKGGIGIRGGPGETQLEKDRRLLNKNIVQILSDLKKIENQRRHNRNRREKIGIPSVSLVGYTNAGKSTLFNVMTLSNVDTAKKLFVTLDPTFRRIAGLKSSNIILIDTVGFIQNLPQDLITSFKATLQEITQSKLLLHVVDVASKRIEQNINTVNSILHDINIDNIPILLVMNKIDQINKVKPRIDRNIEGIPVRVWISARNSSGILLLKQAIDELIPNRMLSYELKIPLKNNLYQQLYRLQAVKKYQFIDDNTIKLKIYLSSYNWNRLIKYNKSILDYIV